MDILHLERFDIFWPALQLLLGKGVDRAVQDIALRSGFAEQRLVEQMLERGQRGADNILGRFAAEGAWEDREPGQ